MASETDRLPARRPAPFAVGGAFSHGASGEVLKEFATKTYADARPSGWDPAERIKDQEIDGRLALHRAARSLDRANRQIKP